MLLVHRRQEVSASMDEGLHRVNRACDSGQRLLPRATPEGKTQVEAEMKEAKESWDTLSKDVNTMSSQLETQAAKWEAYSERNGGLTTWLTDVEAELKQGAEPKVELMEKKAQLDKFKVSSTRMSITGRQGQTRVN